MMSIPSISYNDVIQIFSNANAKDTYIHHDSFVTTKDERESATITEVTALAQIAINGLKQKIQDKSEGAEKLLAQAQVVKNYLHKVQDIIQGIFPDLCNAIVMDIEELADLEGSINKLDLKLFSDEELSKFAKYEEIHKNLQRSGIRSQETKIRLAKLTAKQDGGMISSFIQYYNISDQKTLIEIAKLAAQQNARRTSGLIKNYNIKDQTALIEIAKLAAARDGEGTSEYIQCYGIKDQEALIEIAKSIAQTGASISFDIQNYGIKNQKVLIEIAKLAAQHNGISLAAFIQNYKIDNDQEALIKIAELAVHQNPEVSQFIQNFGIDSINQTALIRIAEISARQNGMITSQHIKKYGIKDQKALIKIALLAAENNGETSLFIQNYEISEDQEALIKIAKIIAHKDGAAVSRSIRAFGIKDQNALIEIAKLAVRQNGLETTRYIREYGIKDPQALIEIAKLAFYQNGDGASEVIKNYGIKDPKVLIEIAKIAATQNGKEVSRYIKNYEITEQQALIEIAKLAAKQNGFGINLYISLYGIEDQEALITIAKTAASQSGNLISRNIFHYGIKDQRALIEIAKLSAKDDGLETSMYINYYHIEDQEALVEIAKIAVQQPGLEVSQNIRFYGIKKETDRFAIFLIALKNNPKSLMALRDYYYLTLPKEIYFLSQNSTLSELQEGFHWPEEFSPVFKELQQKDPKEEDISFLIYVRYKLLQKPLNLKNSDVWSAILKYKDDRMRYELADMIFDLDEKQAKLYAGTPTSDYLLLPTLFTCFSSKSEEDIKNYTEILKEKRILRDGMLQKALLDALFPLIVQSHFKPNEVMKLLETAFKGNIKSNLYSIQGILSCGGEDFLRKEAQNENPDLEVAYQAAFARTIPIKPVKEFATKYERTFGRCALPPAPLTYAGRLRQLPRNEQELALPALGSFVHSVLEGDYPKMRYKTSEGLDKESNHLKFIFDKKPSLQKDWPLEVEMPLEDHLPATATKSAFDPQRFLGVKILLDKHLPREKYPVIYEFLETKEEKIAEGLSTTLKEIAAREKKKIKQTTVLRNVQATLKDIEKIDNVEGRLKTLRKIARQLQKNEFIIFDDIIKGIESIPTQLRLDLKKEADPIRSQTVQKFIDQLKKGVEEQIKLAVPDEEHQRLLLQKDLIDLYKNEKANLSTKLNLLNKIQGKLSQSRDEFRNDVEGIIKALNQEKQTYEGYTITNTDRFDLMLLCGTQVQGSCQRIDGDPKLNKCLLAYLLDGKNRMIAIKDKNGNIVARSILRLLWDKKKECPVLMQERNYSNIMETGFLAALDKFALAQAERLGISLYKQSDMEFSSLESFGSIAPWEYVDSADGVHANGKFTITKANLVSKV